MKRDHHWFSAHGVRGTVTVTALGSVKIVLSGHDCDNVVESSVHPATAREIAAALLKAADVAEGLEPVCEGCL